MTMTREQIDHEIAVRQAERIAYKLNRGTPAEIVHAAAATIANHGPWGNCLVAVYHGSLTEAHGPARIDGFCSEDCEPCADDEDNGHGSRMRLIVTIGGVRQMLLHVRSDSYTVTCPDGPKET